VNALRVIAYGLAFNVKTLSASSFFVMSTVVQPVIFASIAFFLFRAGGRPTSLLYVAIGAGFMGIWTSTLFASGGLIRWQRWQRTLELSVAAPPSLVLIFVPMAIAAAAIGLYAVLATLVWGRLFFDVPLDIAHPLAFAVALPTAIVSLGLLGLVLASTFIHYRHTNALGNLLEYPVWLLSGLLVPVTLLPSWAEPLSWLVAPTWGVRAVREAALGGTPWFDVAMCAALGAIYLVLGAALLRVFERMARRDATLALE
jgi:ABC-2 type transport system permease protein